jgi:hypothetical protein
MEVRATQDDNVRLNQDELAVYLAVKPESDHAAAHLPHLIDKVPMSDDLDISRAAFDNYVPDRVVLWR